MKCNASEKYTYDIPLPNYNSCKSCNLLMKTKNGIIIPRKDVEKILEMSWFSWDDLFDAD